MNQALYDFTSRALTKQKDLPDIYIQTDLTTLIIQPDDQSFFNNTC